MPWMLLMSALRNFLKRLKTKQRALNKRRLTMKFERGLFSFGKNKFKSSSERSKKLNNSNWLTKLTPLVANSKNFLAGAFLKQKQQSVSKEKWLLWKERDVIPSKDLSPLE